ncbi:uncharacterized protein TNCT_641511, partial [Trichonephila clavata]
MKKRPPANADGWYDCLRKQVCECNLPDRYAECFDYMTQETRDWWFDRINECGVVSLEYGSFRVISNAFCSIDPDEAKGCYEDVNKQFMERVKQAASGALGPEENAAMEAARKCIEPNISFCIAFPDNCM